MINGIRTMIDGNTLTVWAKTSSRPTIDDRVEEAISEPLFFADAVLISERIGHQFIVPGLFLIAEGGTMRLLTITNSEMVMDDIPPQLMDHYMEMKIAATRRP